MNSRLLDIYAALQALPILLEGKAIPCYGLEDSGIINTTPLRVLSPLSDKADGRSVTPMTFGGALTLQWHITDLGLIASVTEGSSIEFHKPRIVAYQAEYVNKAFQDKHLGIVPKTITVNSIDIEIGAYEYPLISGQWFYGVKATWTIRENL